MEFENLRFLFSDVQCSLNRALICVLEREEVGTEAIGDHQFSSKVPSGHTREHCLIMLQDSGQKR